MIDIIDDSEDMLHEPAPEVVVPPGVKKWLWLAMVVTVVAGTIALIASVARSPEQPQVANIATQPKEVMVISMSANSDSSHISTRPGYAIDYTGSGFSVHCVYRDGSEGIIGDSTRPCKNGPMLEQYVQDTTGKANTVTYKFVRPN